MILADTSAWIDYLAGRDTAAAVALDRAIVAGGMVMGDLILAEILRGTTSERQASIVERALDPFQVFALGGREVAVAAAQHYRALRGQGITIRGTIDLMIGAWCIRNRAHLIYADRDFAAMEQWLGLKRWIG